MSGGPGGRDYTHVLYHGNCYDGFGAALAAWGQLFEQAEYVPCLYGQEVPDLPADARVLMVDFSYDRETLLALRERVAELVVLDHHKTAAEALEGLDFAVFDLDKSGAVLAWEHFWPGLPVPEFFLYLQDRDLWRFELPDSKGVSQALRAYPFEFRVWEELLEDMGPLRAAAPVVEQFTAQMVALMADKAVWSEVGGHRVPVANATCFFSEVGDELCRRHPDAPFAAYYLDRDDGLRQWGLRSRNGFDTSVVAKRYGGGGHPAASGFTTLVPALGLEGAP